MAAAVDGARVLVDGRTWFESRSSELMSCAPSADSRIDISRGLLMPALAV
eukprot:CAMPEP_0172755564 /NCGR_PEP_ID=MMETSP1074-20121228/160086_1 /TAXON_ID=2916 /ORGANISM="Ceratium fusus, Strain PA161109" /LENGTH=49 /DNA_ID=CAMNT_0013588673 /DNA_START=166 /DNA_END=315 /DNA_ORIENTATION=+